MSEMPRTGGRDEAGRDLHCLRIPVARRDTPWSGGGHPAVTSPTAAPTSGATTSCCRSRRQSTVVSLGEGMTPLLWTARRLGTELGIDRLLIKDDGLLPTGSFKARGAAVGRLDGRESSARAGWRCRPTATPAPPGRRTRLAQDSRCSSPCHSPRPPITARGDRRDRRRSVAGRRADLRRRPIWSPRRSRRVQMPGSTSPRSRSRTGSRARRRWGSRSPNSSAGGCPTSIIYPTGGGVGLIGIHKALIELLALGWVEGRTAAAGLRPVDRMRADRARLRGGRRECRSHGPTPAPSRSG